ncbi:MAG: RiPP maturation radical SAM C-methyltransferase [Pseudomonadota bacterium]
MEPALDVVIAVPPYGPLSLPSIGAGILKAGLRERGIRSEVAYLNLEFADRIGLAPYEFLGVSSGPALLGEWTFSHVAFPEYAQDEAGYLSFAEAFLAGRFGDKSAPAMARLMLQQADLGSAVRNIRTVAQSFIEGAARAIVSKGPRIVGCSSTFQQHCASLALLRHVKVLDPGIVTVLGGGNCDGPMGRISHEAFDWVDWVSSGEADLSFPTFCRAILDGRVPPELPGFFGGPGSTPEGEHRAIVEDLAETPIPDLGDYYATLKALPLARYIDPVTPIETSRGCWWGEISHCTFCGLNGSGMAYRSKSADRVMAEFDHLGNECGSRRFAAVDNILDMRHFEMVLPRLAAASVDREVFFETKANLGRDKVRQLAEAGITSIQPGIESLNDGALRRMGKGNTAIVNLRLLKFAREAGVDLKWSILCGMPGERDDDYAEMARLCQKLHHLCPPLDLNPIEWHRFSPYHQRPEEFGLELEPFGSYRFIYPLAGSALKMLAYVFQDRHAPASPQRGPGWHRLRQAIRDWRAAWTASELPQLAMESAGSSGFTDTRGGTLPAAKPPDVCALAILEALDTGQREAGFAKTFASRETRFSMAQVQATLDGLLNAGYVVRSGSSLISVVTRELGPECRNSMGYGQTDIAAYLNDRIAARLRAAHSPRDIPIRDLFPSH